MADYLDQEWHATAQDFRAAELALAEWLGPITPTSAQSPIYEAMCEAGRIADGIESDEALQAPITPESADRIGDLLVIAMATDLACGAGYFGFDAFDRVASVEALTGRDLEREAYESFS